MRLSLKITVLVLLLTLILTISLSGCNFYTVEPTLTRDENTHIKFNYLEDDRWEFQGNIYYVSPMLFLESEEYEYLGWIGSRFWYTSHIYTNSLTDPVIIYDSTYENTYLREDYDYRKDNFLIDGTDDIISFADNLLYTDYENTELFNREHVSITISSVTYPSLSAMLCLVKDQGVWYAIPLDMNNPYRLSENFVNILVDNKIVPSN